MPNSRNKLLAIDPGTREMGFATFENKDLTDYGVKAISQGRTTKELFSNVERIVTNLIKEKRPTIMVLEKNDFSQITQNARLTLAMARMKAVAKRQGIPIIEYHPRTVRKVVCKNGNAIKTEVARTVTIIYPEMKAYLKSNRQWKERYFQNIFDAIACGLTHIEIRNRRYTDSKIGNDKQE